MNELQEIADRWPEERAMGPPNSYPAGTGLFRQGDRVRALYLIEAGLVKLIRSERAGRDVLVGLRTSGWLLGTAAGILGVVHPVSAETLGVCELRQISVANLVLLAREAPVSSWLHRMLSRELHEEIALLGQFGAMAPRRRLERILARLAKDGGETREDGSVRLMISLKQHELAQAIGATREHVGRLLARLE